MKKLRLALSSAAVIFAVLYVLDVTGMLTMVRGFLWYYCDIGEQP